LLEQARLRVDGMNAEKLGHGSLPSMEVGEGGGHRAAMWRF
jgi:hypothetical protein